LAAILIGGLEPLIKPPRVEQSVSIVVRGGENKDQQASACGFGHWNEAVRLGLQFDTGFLTAENTGCV